LNDGSKPNKAALALTKSNLLHDWRGNILILAHQGQAFDNPYPEYQDSTLADLRSAVDYLTWYGSDSANTRSATDTSNIKKKMEEMTVEETTKEETKVKGVLIRCEGEMKLKRASTGYYQRYVEQSVTKHDPIWKQQPIYCSTTSEFLFWYVNSHTILPGTKATLHASTTNLRFLAPPEWQSGVGNVLVVRKDGKDIGHEQVYAFAEYMQFAVSDAFEGALYGSGVRERKAAVLRS
jgi:hypothetical protein